MRDRDAATWPTNFGRGAAQAEMDEGESPLGPPKESLGTGAFTAGLELGSPPALWQQDSETGFFHLLHLHSSLASR